MGRVHTQTQMAIVGLIVATILHCVVRFASAFTLTIYEERHFPGVALLVALIYLL